MPEFLVFDSAGEQWAVPLDDVQEIVDDMAVTPLPLLPDAVAGVVAVRGLPLPAINFSRFARGVEEGVRSSVILRARGRTLALRIGMVLGIVSDSGERVADDPRAWVTAHVNGIAVVDPAGILEALPECRS